MPPVDSPKICPCCQNCITNSKDVDPKAFPFCSMRCKLIDLGAWASQEYRIPAESADAIDDDADDET